jgi:hypothetical protein
MKLLTDFRIAIFIMTVVLSLSIFSRVHAAEEFLDKKVEKITAEVLAVDRENRIVTLRGTNDNVIDVKVGPEARNFDQIEIGDQVNITYYDSLAVYIGEPGSKPGVMKSDSLTRAPKGEKPAGMIMETSDISATVQAIDRTERKVTLKGPKGKIKTVNVENSVTSFDRLKVGDTVHVRYTEAVAISVEEPDAKETMIINAEVLAVDRVDRILVLKGTNGNVVSVKVGEVARNFNQIKVGDQIKVEFYEALAVYIGDPGSKPTTKKGGYLKRAPVGEKPAGVFSETIDISASVQSVDRVNRTVTLKGPEGNVKTLRVDSSVAAFNSLHVGDTVHVRYTEAMAVSVTKP